MEAWVGLGHLLQLLQLVPDLSTCTLHGGTPAFQGCEGEQRTMTYNQQLLIISVRKGKIVLATFSAGVLLFFLSNTLEFN